MPGPLDHDLAQQRYVRLLQLLAFFPQMVVYLSLVLPEWTELDVFLPPASNAGRTPAPSSSCKSL